jgi:hypothetical protein
MFIIFPIQFTLNFLRSSEQFSYCVKFAKREIINILTGVGIRY